MVWDLSWFYQHWLKVKITSLLVLFFWFKTGLLRHQDLSLILISSIRKDTGDLGNSLNTHLHANAIEEESVSIQYWKNHHVQILQLFYLNLTIDQVFGGNYKNWSYLIYLFWCQTDYKGTGNIPPFRFCIQLQKQL